MYVYIKECIKYSNFIYKARNESEIFALFIYYYSITHQERERERARG
jgi:hypothetical protein